MTTLIAATAAGKVRGAEVSDGVLAWRGIPYAAAPVGPLRLRPPQPAEPWAGIRDAVAYGPPSLQPPPDTAGFLGGTVPGLPPPSEDCLYLNVTAPAGASRNPVLVWIHGGGYQSGSGTDMAGDGAAFARDHGLVVVTFNYRLGALGYLSLAGEEHTGAYGLYDQIAALRWVRDNIAGFGGDPGRVTVYGLSAGAKSVANLLASPLARGLVHRAASSSGGADHVATPEQAANVARRFFRELGGVPARVRDVPAQDILAAQTAIARGLRGAFVWRPAVDGLALTGPPLDAIAAGSAAGVPLLAQTCVDECALYQLAVPDAAEQADRVLEEQLGPAHRDAILAAYAASRPELARDPERLRVAVMSDERYGVPTARLADTQSAHAPVWRSRYEGPFTGLAAVMAPFADLLRAAHGGDGTAVWAGGDGPAGQLHALWGAFATGRAPAAAGLPEWPPYTTARRAIMILDPDGPYVADDPHPLERAAWDGHHWPSSTWWHFAGVE
ncbi:carboxylesterase family protein [Streptomyces sp. B1866]|uniref:carboxylesterase/lipase family protein n=1 Tax=Streptomyces sp. B1866 TaxID=3075431 RepID=UPI00288ED1D5|nr:carboxylesterase family protein [Streptomyces sp. B1866]MDT3397722.1 carboxylesterase family protein [Streptomyces sp. B1866]